MGPLTLFLTAGVLLALLATGWVAYACLHPKRKTYAYALANNWPTDPRQLGFEFIEQQFQLADGTATTGWIIQGTQCNGPLIVMTHGWNSSRYAMLHRVPVMTPFASRVLVYDLRGHGDSTASITHMGTTESDDLQQILGQIDGQGQPLVLYGSSMGAGVTLAAAAVASPAGPPLAGVIVEGPYRSFQEPLAGQLRARNLPAFPLTNLTTAFLAWYLGGLSGFDRVALAGRVPCPLLVLHGTADPICHLDSGQQIANAAAQGRLVTFVGAGHGNLALYDEPRYLEALTRFFEAVQSHHATTQANTTLSPVH